MLHLRYRIVYHSSKFCSVSHLCEASYSDSASPRSATTLETTTASSSPTLGCCGMVSVSRTFPGLASTSGISQNGEFVRHQETSSQDGVSVTLKLKLQPPPGDELDPDLSDLSVSTATATGSPGTASSTISSPCSPPAGDL